MRRRVVVTGMGCVTPLGCDPREAWTNMIAGRSGIGEITLFDARDFPVHIAAEVPDWGPQRVPELEAGCHARQTEFAFASALQAYRNAGLSTDDVDPLRLGVYLGCGEVYPDFDRFAQLVAQSLEQGHVRLDRFLTSIQHDQRLPAQVAQQPDAPVGLIAGQLDARGPSANYTTACVSSSVAVGEAVELIRGGTADVMLAGGAHSMIHPFGITGFYRLSALSTRQGEPQTVYCPFDRERDGFVIGEGGAVFVLEELEHARRRAARIVAEIAGYGSTHDAFRVTDPRGDGARAAGAIRLALRDAQLGADQVDYINAHGSGTELNDRAETLAVKMALGPAAYQIPISSTKSMTGHLTTACGAIELLACLMAVQHDVVPPTINYLHTDPECDLDYVPNTAREIRCRHAVNNNFGFGGHNVSLVVSRFKP